MASRKRPSSSNAHRAISYSPRQLSTSVVEPSGGDPVTDGREGISTKSVGLPTGNGWIGRRCCGHDESVDATSIRLRPLRRDDEQACLGAHAALAADGFEFLLCYDPSRSWPEHLQRTHEMMHGRDLPDGWVPGVFLVAELNDVIVGRSSVRFALNPWLEIVGGHIGYGVLAQHRRRGHATEILRQSLVIARAHGVDDVLVTCDENNTASIGVIERCGGHLDGLVDNPAGGPRKRRYWFH